MSRNANTRSPTLCQRTINGRLKLLRHLQGFPAGLRESPRDCACTFSPDISGRVFAALPVSGRIKVKLRLRRRIASPSLARANECLLAVDIVQPSGVKYAYCQMRNFLYLISCTSRYPGRKSRQVAQHL
jgi:hypothetical protein